MRLLLVRHAQAAAQDPGRFPDDSLRPLLPKGRRIQRRLSAQLVKRGLTPTRVFSSPWKRAWQTARIVLEEAGLRKHARIPCQALAAPPDLGALAAEIGMVGPDEVVALVGHEPWMSSLAALLLTGPDGGLHIDFPKSGIMGIETAGWEPGCGVLLFFLVP